MSHPKGLESILGFTWKSKLCYWPSRWDLNLLNTPAPPPSAELEEIDERLASALGGNGSEPVQH